MSIRVVFNVSVHAALRSDVHSIIPAQAVGLCMALEHGGMEIDLPGHRYLRHAHRASGIRLRSSYLDFAWDLRLPKRGTTIPDHFILPSSLPVTLVAADERNDR